MQLSVREMKLSEVNLVIDYFFHSTAEFLDAMGVDPSRLLAPEAWYAKMEVEFALPLRRRQWFPVIWLLDGDPVGYSSCDRITFGEQANMHLHVTRPELRRQGIGTECVRKSIEIYFENFRLKKLFCQPYALNVQAHRTLQKVGFKYVKTYMTVPGPINYHQAVTQWVIDRAAEAK
jgi:RimJ/RimL family protein N-acetyltransferase